MTAEARALNALWRNHPLTAVEDRWGERAHRMARANRDMLLSWAATQPDYRLRDCRTIGTATLAWIRANEPTAAAPDPAPLDVERLARAVSLVMSDLDWTPAPIGVVQNSYWQDRAEGIAREYAALAAIEGDKE